MNYETEEEFLNNYNPNKYEKLSLTTDLVIFGIRDEESNNYRKNSKKIMSILLSKREVYPFKDKWCLPGGFVNPKEETLEDAARRILKRETNLSRLYLEQLCTFDAVDRDPRMRIISCAYVALVDRTRLKQEVTNACWFDIVSVEEKNGVINIALTNGHDNLNFSVKKNLKDKTSRQYTFSTKKNDCLAFDHDIVIYSALDRLKNKINYTDIVFNMMSEYFTLSELQQVYEVILGKELLDPAFRRIIADKVVKTDKMKTGDGHRPSYLFRYKRIDED